MRIGQGFDIHPFASDPHRALVLGGIPVDGGRGLAGHSDADAVAHAIADALLGAAGLGDLGRHFPDDDPTWAGADSIALLVEVVARVVTAGFRPVNADCTIIAEAPRLAPFTGRMAERLAAAIGAPVSVKATRAEGLGALGRAEGIACTAVVLLDEVTDPAGGPIPASGGAS
ncbi:MAG TPA: 2-C-methyl-D-erythritol 2,4-cyclodiphosphate synthase [Acidimicrobiales bacterium]|jgi:2-C-methyl-D-erythritol 2,4-cyclodiphosphate synthase|nr:2-C-methyl-D-erythritol 2,4-cyclodiphosphate synthase [Acidimicrobiales bacterium]